MITTKTKNKKAIDYIGKKPVVILPLDDYEKMKEEIDMLSSKNLADEISKARHEVENKEVYSLQEIKRKLSIDK